MDTEGERLVTLETDMKTVKRDVAETKADVKMLLGFYHAQAGFASGLGRLAPWVAVIVSIVAILRVS